MKVYIVKYGKDCEEPKYRAFSSNSAAKDFVQESADAFVRKRTRDYELTLLRTLRDLTDDEENERRDLCAWKKTEGNDATRYQIIELEIQE